MTNMKQIALMLGLEWDEDKGESQIFYVNGYTFPYKLSGNKLQCKKYGCWQESTIIFNELFNVGIKLPPWKPKPGETYYIADITSDIYYYKTFWDNTDYDNRQFDRKILCRTKEEAIELTKKMLELAKGESV